MAADGEAFGHTGITSFLVSLFNEFYRFFSREVFDIHPENRHTVNSAVNLLLQAHVITRAEPFAEQPQRIKFFLLVFNDRYSSECYHASEVGSVFRWFHVILVNDAEGASAIASDGINFVSADSGMKEQLSILIDVADGDGIGITAITDESQNSRCGFLKNCDTFSRIKLLPMTAHGSEFHFMISF